MMSGYSAGRIIWFFVFSFVSMHFTASDIMYEACSQFAAYARMELVGGMWAEEMKQAALTFKN
jgi:hypothetical protein